MASAGLSGVYAPLPKPSVLFVLAMLRVWEITLLLGSGWLRLIGAYSVGVRSRHFRLSFSLAHKFFPQTMPIVGSFVGEVLLCRCKRTQTQQAQYNEFGKEMGLNEDFIKGLTGTLGSGIIKGVEERQKSILELSPRMNSSSSQFSDASRPELSGVLRVVILLLSCEISVVIYHSAPFILTVHLLIIQVAT